MSSQSINWQTTFTAKVVDCEKAQQDSYAKDIDCKYDQSTNIGSFPINIHQVFTHFDPDIYSEENKFQLYNKFEIVYGNVY